jgi:polyphosphate glucokinase
MRKKNRVPTPRARASQRAAKRQNTLAIDIGGSGLKASVLDEDGAMLTGRVRVETPPRCTPELMVETLARLVAPLPAYHRVSVGFPGVVRNGVILTAHNLGTDAWRGFALDQALASKLGKPVRVLNDADIQGLGAIKGEGVEMVITLGTGMGSSLFEDGRLSAHLELAHHPFRKGDTYEEQLGNAALEEVGKRRWKKRVGLAVETLRELTSFDHLYLGGGNAGILGEALPPGVSIVSNDLGMRGGIWLWRERGRSAPGASRRTVKGRSKVKAKAASRKAKQAPVKPSRRASKSSSKTASRKR